MGENKPHLLSIDLGTTSVKVGLFGADGGMEALSTQEYTLETPEKDRVELPVEVYWNAIVSGVRDVLKTSNVSTPSVRAISLSSQGETLVCVDSDGNALTNAIVWLDARAGAESDRLSKLVPPEELYTITGYPEMAAVWPAAKILWFAKNEPEIFRKTAKFLLLKDYFVWKLTGVYATDLSESSSTLYLDVQSGKWWDAMLNEIGISPDRLPDILESTDVAGELLPDAATELGLETGTKVITGAMDQVAAAVGAGNTAPGLVTESTGTALAVIASVGHPVFDEERRIPCSAHFRSGLFALMPYAETSGIVLKWFRDTFADSGKAPSYDDLMALASGVEPGAEGLRALPHFTGTACPDFNVDARGAFTGISFQHGRAHFVRALVESVAFLLRENIDLIKSLSIEVSKVRSLGGASNSDLWCQIKADVLGVPIEVPECGEAASLGAAILAGIGAGVYSGVDEAVKNLVTIDRSFEPDAETSSRYEEIYQDYLGIYSKLYG